MGERPFRITIPRNTVSLRVDYGKPDWRVPAPGEPGGARAGEGGGAVTLGWRF